MSSVINVNVMSYPPKTKLYYSESDHATVVTGGNVVVTKGLCKGHVLKLEDWLILGDMPVHVLPTSSQVIESPKSPRLPFQEPLTIQLPTYISNPKPLDRSLSTPEILAQPEVELCIYP